MNERKWEMRKSFVKGTMLGAVVAGVAALLLAPKSGKETRDDINRKVRGTYKDIQNKLEKMSDEMNGRVESLREAAKDLKGEAREESQELIRRAEVLKQDLRVSANNLKDSGTQTKDVAVKEVKSLDRKSGCHHRLYRRGTGPRPARCRRAPSPRG
jgi:gas vesicle protein